MITSLTDLRKYLFDIGEYVTFDYNGYSCGVNPLFKEKYELWYGNEFVIVKSIDEAFSKPFFNGKALNDIWSDITNINY